MLCIFVLVSIFLIFIGYTITKKIFNPITIFNLIWLIIVLLYQLRLSRLQNILYLDTYKIFLINNMVYSLFFIFMYTIKFKNSNNQNLKNKVINYKIIKKLFFIWCFIEIIEIIFSKGLPIIWLLKSSSKTYMDFGIPTLHGFMNALGLVIILLSWYLILYYKNNKNKKKLLKIIIFMLVYYLCLITRQVIISAAIEMFGLYIFFKKNFPWKKFLIFTVFGIIFFGILGNVRTGYNGFLNVSGLKINKINKFFIGIYWVYMYLTMTIANINYDVINKISGYGLYPIANSFIPTVIANILFKNSSVVIPNSIVTPAFNVSGYFKEFFLGYGLYGVVIISSIYGILGGLIYKKYCKFASEKNMLYYAIYLQIIILSFFANHLLYLPSGFQLFIVHFLFYKGEKDE